MKKILLSLSGFILLFVSFAYIGLNQVQATPSRECWEVITYKGCYWKDAGQSCTLFFGNKGKLCKRVCDINLVCAEPGQSPHAVDNYEVDTGQTACVATFGSCKY